MSLGSLGGMLGGAIDIPALLDQLRQGGGHVVVINPGSAAGAPMPPIGGGAGGPPGMPPMPPPEPGPEMISNGAPPALGPDAEGPAENIAEGGMEEPQDMMGAAKAALLKKGPPKPPSKGVGKGPANPQTKPGSAKMPEKKAVAPKQAAPVSKKAPPKKGK
jgi:hypothetical protein